MNQTLFPNDVGAIDGADAPPPPVPPVPVGAGIIILLAFSIRIKQRRKQSNPDFLTSVKHICLHCARLSF